MNHFLPNLIYLWQGAASSISGPTPVIESRPLWMQVWFWIGIIITAFLCGVGLLVRYWLFLRREEHSLARLEENLSALRRQGKRWDEKIDGVLLEEVHELSIQRKIVEMAHATRRQGAGLNPDAACDLLTSELHRKLSGARYVAGTLILLGLMGTLLGLSGTVKELALAAQSVGENLQGNSDPSSPKKKISSEAAVQELLRPWKNGMNNAASAFGASLSGVTTTVLFLLLLSFAQKQGSRFGTDVRTFVVTQLVPLMSIPEAKQSFAQMSAQLVKHGELLQALVSKMAFQAKAIEEDSSNAAVLLRSSDEREARFLEKLGEYTRTHQQSVEGLMLSARAALALQESSAETLQTTKVAIAGFEKEISSIHERFDRLLRLSIETYKQQQKFYQAGNDFSWGGLASNVRSQTEKLEEIRNELATGHDEYYQTQVAVRSLREIFEQRLSNEEFAVSALQRLPEPAFWTSLEEKLAILPFAAATFQENVAVLITAAKDLASAASMLNRPAVDRPVPVDSTWNGGKSDFSSLKVAMVEAIESGFRGSSQPIVQVKEPVEMIATTDDLQTSMVLLGQSLERQARIQEELLAYNRRIYDILDRSYLLKTAWQRIRGVWRRKRPENGNGIAYE